MWTQLFLHQIKIFWNIQQFISKIKNQKVDGKDFYVVALQSVVLLIFNVRVLFKNNLDIIQDTSPPVLVHLRHLFFPHKHFLLKISNNIITWEWLMTLPWYKTKYKNLKVDLYMYMTHISMKTLYQIFFVLLQGRKLSKTRKTYGKLYMRSTELYVSVTRLTHML